uniref:Uncharacterized protein n=1 Tax=Panagrolaimus sp. JU765 TaxID=591449 RepID=A0AC34PZ22_9BILA
MKIITFLLNFVSIFALPFQRGKGYYDLEGVFHEEDPDRGLHNLVDALFGLATTFLILISLGFLGIQCYVGYYCWWKNEKRSTYKKPIKTPSKVTKPAPTPSAPSAPATPSNKSTYVHQQNSPQTSPTATAPK